jgi:FtsP/CotA-like multicopper oxidase with cupredoxin domain
MGASALLWASPIRILTTKAATGVNRFAVPLPRPAVLTGADIALQAAVTDVSILPGAPTRMWTFNGTFPGPIIRRPSQQRTTVTLSNGLSESLTLHRHGGHQASTEDGQPADELVAPGASRTYVYDLTEDGGGERAAMEWYHDHSFLRTGRNTWMGLLGLFIVDDGLDASLGLPTGDYDVPLVVTDRSFDQNNQLIDPFTAPGTAARGPGESIGAGYPPGDEVVGDTILVNGAVQPFLDVAARRYRLRILNASNFQTFNLARSDGRALVQIGNESGLLPQPVSRSSLLLGPAERGEIVIDFSGMEGASIVLASTPLTGGAAVPKTAPAIADIMQLRVGAAQPDMSTVPPALRPLPPWAANLSHTPNRVFVFGLGVDQQGRSAWTINGQGFDHARVDARPELGSTETWMFINTGPVPVSHYIHIHDVHWRLLSRNLALPDPWEAGLKETFRLDPGEVLLVGSKFTDHLGRYMIHCHMLEHEDHGMMTTFEVVPPGQGDAPTSHVAAADPVTALVRAQLPPISAGAALAVLDRVAATGRPAPMSVLDRPLPPVVLPYVCKLNR